MFLKKTRITHKIIMVIVAGIFISAAFAACAVLIGKKETRTLEGIYIENVGPLDNLRNIQLVFREIEYRMAGVQADLVGAIGSGKHLEKSLKEINNAWKDSENILKASGLNDDAAKAVAQFNKGYDNFTLLASGLKKVYLDNEPEKVEDFYDKYLDLKPLIFKSINKLAQKLKEDVKNQYMESQKTIKMMNTLITIIAIAAIGFFITFALFILRSINKPISIIVDAAGKVAQGDLTHSIDIDSEDEMGNMASRLNDMIDHLGSAFHKIVADVENITAETSGLSDLSEKLLDGSRDQSEKGDHVVVAAAEMSQTLVDVAKNTSDASAATRESTEMAVKGKETVSRTVESISELDKSVRETSDAITGLGNHLSAIGNIVSVIQDIASQTNLLALNAAIEAARSGEHGRGFAVVAEEVKKLAERTAHATDEITGKITTISRESENSISMMEQGKQLATQSVSNAKEAGENLQQIVNSSSTVMDMVQRIAAATEEQSTTSEEVSNNMEQISEVIKNNFRLSEEMKKALAGLSYLAQDVMVQTMYFKTADNETPAAGEQPDTSYDLQVAVKG
jgi:methyl-accepting chemotaxis protein